MAYIQVVCLIVGSQGSEGEESKTEKEGAGDKDVIASCPMLQATGYLITLSNMSLGLPPGKEACVCQFPAPLVKCCPMGHLLPNSLLL